MDPAILQLISMLLSNGVPVKVVFSPQVEAAIVNALNAYAARAAG